MKPIKGFEGLYSADKQGFIWSHRQNKRMKVFINNSGYECLVLNSGKNPKKFLVHRLVAEVFVPNHKGLEVVDHINGNKLDNSAKNLEWCSYTENARRSWANGLSTHKGTSHYLAKLTDDKVRKIRTLLEKGFTQARIAKRFNVSVMTINKIALGRGWKHVV